MSPVAATTMCCFRGEWPPTAPKRSGRSIGLQAPACCARSKAIG
jgi:hypothetical protein